MKNRIGMKILTAAVSLLLVTVIAAGLAGCSSGIKSENLMNDVKPAKSKGDTAAIALSSIDKASDFAVRLFRASCVNGKNTLISPLSVLAALSMTSNGAKGETLSQMESVLGMSKAELNEFFVNYMKSLPNTEKYKLSLANSVWFTSDSRFTVNKDFLQTNADYYGADVFKAAFDGSTLKDINNWVKGKTDGMIPEILDQIPPEAVMYLINALAFEAEWEEIYEKNQVRDGSFTLENGSEKTADFMYATESRYIEDEKATGFIKHYSGRKYAFVALLPKEGVTVAEYVSSLDGQKLHKMLASPQTATVETAIPKFETEYSVEMSDVLSSMGMPVAFDQGKADFSGLGTSTAGNISISRVIHKTFISVAEKGTRAGAATVVEMVDNAAWFGDEIKTVILDRPFVYMLIDTESCLPFFIGTLMDVGA